MKRFRDKNSVKCSCEQEFEVPMHYTFFNRNKEKEKNKILSLPKKWLKMMTISLEFKVFVVSHSL